LPKIWLVTFLVRNVYGKRLWNDSNGKNGNWTYRRGPFGSEFPAIYNHCGVLTDWSRKTWIFLWAILCFFIWKNDPLKLSLLRGSRPKSARASSHHIWLTVFQISSNTVHFRWSYCRTREGRFCPVEYFQYRLLEPIITSLYRNDTIYWYIWLIEYVYYVMNAVIDLYFDIALEWTYMYVKFTEVTVWHGLPDHSFRVWCITSYWHSKSDPNHSNIYGKVKSHDSTRSDLTQPVGWTNVRPSLVRSENRVVHWSARTPCRRVAASTLRLLFCILVSSIVVRLTLADYHGLYCDGRTWKWDGWAIASGPQGVCIPAVSRVHRGMSLFVCWSM